MNWSGDTDRLLPLDPGHQQIVFCAIAALSNILARMTGKSLRILTSFLTLNPLYIPMESPVYCLIIIINDGTNIAS